MASEQIESALRIVEKERASLTRSPVLSVQAVLSLGAVTYVTEHLTDPMRRAAHRCATTDQTQQRDANKNCSHTDVEKNETDQHNELENHQDYKVDRMVEGRTDQAHFHSHEEAVADNMAKLKIDKHQSHVDETLPQDHITKEADTLSKDAIRTECDTSEKRNPAESNHTASTSEPTTDADLCSAYRVMWLHFFKVQQYMDDVRLHIQKLQEIGQLIFPHDQLLLHRFRVHDCTKFQFEEVYGYVLRWTHGLDCAEWQVALNHHYVNNDHHPEFYAGEEMDKPALVESAVDMLSWRVIKNRSSFPDSPLQEWLFDVEDKYLARYVESDRQEVKILLRSWKNMNLDLSLL